MTSEPCADITPTDTEKDYFQKHPTKNSDVVHKQHLCWSHRRHGSSAQTSWLLSPHGTPQAALAQGPVNGKEGEAETINTSTLN